MTSVSHDNFSTADPYVGRSAPWSQEAEQAVLAAMLLDQDAALRAAETVDDTMFYREGHRRLFRAMLALTERRVVIDHITLRDELLRRGELEAAGGLEYLAELVDAVPTAANLEFHAKIVRDKAILRRLIEAGTSIITEAYDGHSTANDLLDVAESKIFTDLPAARERRVHAHQGDAVAHDGAHRNAPAQRQSDYRRAERIPRFGFADVGVPEFRAGGRRGPPIDGQDGVLSQHRRQRGGRGAGGSHLLAGNVEGIAGAAHAHRHRPGGQPPGAAGHAAGTPTSPSSRARPASCRRYQLWIDDTPSLTLLEMRSKARRLKIDNDLRLIIVDYLQLMRSPEHAENRVQEISDISRSLKALARELQIPVIALSQLSRASEQRGGERKPILSDLRDSGAIEQDADLVIFIHRPEVLRPGGRSRSGAWRRSCWPRTATARRAM